MTPSMVTKHHRGHLGCGHVSHKCLKKGTEKHQKCPENHSKMAKTLEKEKSHLFLYLGRTATTWHRHSRVLPKYKKR